MITKPFVGFILFLDYYVNRTQYIECKFPYVAVPTKSKCEFNVHFSSVANPTNTEYEAPENPVITISRTR